MKHKILDILDELKPELDETLEADALNEAEIERLTAHLNFEKVWTKTLGLIDKQSHQPVPASTEKIRKKSAGRTRRLICAAAALSLCLGCVSFAAQKGYFEAFFHYNGISDNQIVQVDSSQVSDGVKMTLAEAIPGEIDGVVILAFERVDGQPFPDDVDLKEFDVSLDGQTVGWGSRWRMTDDCKRLLICTEIRGDDAPITGRTLTIDAAGLYSRQTGRPVSDGRWKAAYTFDKSITKNLKAKLNRQLPEGNMEITDVQVSVLGIHLYGKWTGFLEGRDPRGVPSYNPKVAAVMKDGTEIQLTQAEKSITSDTGEYFKYEYIIPDKGGSGQDTPFIDQEFMNRLSGVSVDGEVIHIMETETN